MSNVYELFITPLLAFGEKLDISEKEWQEGETKDNIYLSKEISKSLILSLELDDLSRMITS